MSGVKKKKKESGPLLRITDSLVTSCLAAAYRVSHRLNKQAKEIEYCTSIRKKMPRNNGVLAEMLPTCTSVDCRHSIQASYSSSCTMDMHSYEFL